MEDEHLVLTMESGAQITASPPIVKGRVKVEVSIYDMDMEGV